MLEDLRNYNTTDTYYTRWEHGQYPVTVLKNEKGDTKYHLNSDHSEVTFSRVSDLLTYVMGRDYKNVSFDKYFRIGSYSVEDSFSMDDFVIHPPKILGIDLNKRGHEVKKILMAKFNGWMSKEGYDPEDILQEVYAGIIRRNQGKCPYDSDKSSFGKYVFMVCHCVLANYHRKQKKRTDHEVLGMYTPSDSEGKDHTVDVSSSNSNQMSVEGMGDSDKMARQRFYSYIKKHSDNKRLLENSIKVIPYVLDGYLKSEISKLMGWSPTKTGKVIDHVRAQARAWSSI